jgi:hypothetical protein
MPRSAAQSDFVVYRDAPVELPAGPNSDATGPVELPRAVLQSSEASARATRIVMGLTWFMLAVLAILCMVGPHIPAGE